MVMMFNIFLIKIIYKKNFFFEINFTVFDIYLSLYLPFYLINRATVIKMLKEHPNKEYQNLL